MLFFYIQILKTSFSPARELNYIEYILQQLEVEIITFREMLLRFDDRHAVLSAVGSMSNWLFWYSYIVICTGITQNSK
jgi:hypothetical protein